MNSSIGSTVTPVPITFDHSSAIFSTFELSKRLIENECFTNFFYKYEKLEPIIELYLQIIESNEMSNIRAFLNIVQALETYHSRFKANTLGEYKKRIDEVILKDRPKDFIENDKKFLMANSYKFITCRFISGRF